MSGRPKKPPKSKPTWSDIKGKLADFDRAGLIQLVSDLYSYNKDNQTFLHARFALTQNALEAYKKRISHALYPDIGRRDVDPSVTTARKAISDYTKAVGNPLGILELRVFWCETAVEFSRNYSYSDIGYFEALLRQYRDACRMLPDVSGPQLTQYLERMQKLQDDAIHIGYGVSMEMDDLLDDVLGILPESTEEARIPTIGDKDSSDF